MKIFLPGPTDVRPSIREEMARPPVGHRSGEFRALHREIQGPLRRLLGVERPVYLVTSSATGVMEAAIRNCVRCRSLHLICGAFGERWYEIAVANGKETRTVRVEPGKAIQPSQVREGLKEDEIDAVALVHNETSTGVINPLREIAAVVREFPGVLLLVDVVSSLGAVPIPVTDLRIDVCLAGVQKALALPPGASVCAVSEDALERAKTVPHRGLYFDFFQYEENAARDEAPFTPSIPHLYALRQQLKDIEAEGFERRYRRHAEMAHHVQKWARSRFDLLPEPGVESPTVTAVKDTQGADVGKLKQALREKGKLVASGYGPFKKTGFRIGHMGDLTLEDVQELTRDIDELLEG